MNFRLLKGSLKQYNCKVLMLKFTRLNKSSISNFSTLILNARDHAQHNSHLISVAPMIDVSTPHFLKLLRIIGGPKPQLYTEMYHAGSIINMDRLGILDFRLGFQKDDDYGMKSRENNVVQLGGSDPKQLALACNILKDVNKYCAINLNLGCPSTAVQAGEFGAVLMKYPEKVITLVNTMEESVNGLIPITVKCRLGVDDLDSEEFIFDFVEKLNSKTNIKHFIIHARKCLLKGLSPAKNRTIPPLNYDRVYKLARTFSHLQFTINGGIQTIEDTEDHLKKVDNLTGVMIGRKIMDKPMFLQELVNHLYNENTTLSYQQVYKNYIDYFIEQKKSGHRPTLIAQPIMKLFPGKAGRVFRTKLQTSPLVRNVNFDKPYNEVEMEKDREELNRLVQGLFNHL